ncbi:uncharacterized protein LOC118766215 [Octopus sinensis]|uniref:Uncharacterized protein LOC118766215 n=1 Tax=Octopus sinensis TaxID=2607531 RepID=A0A7E6FCC0_9MOLL|nr:uncharacterized protein LOC118766215 [Octopus sinensis]
MTKRNITSPFRFKSLLELQKHRAKVTLWKKLCLCFQREMKKAHLNLKFLTRERRFIRKLRQLQKHQRQMFLKLTREKLRELKRKSTRSKAVRKIDNTNLRKKILLKQSYKKYKATKFSDCPIDLEIS